MKPPHLQIPAKNHEPKQGALKSVDQRSRHADKKNLNSYATADDRFSFPTVPGYTGYIPRSREHFGKPYVETTAAALADFDMLCEEKSTVPDKLAVIASERNCDSSTSGSSLPAPFRAAENLAGALTSLPSPVRSSCPPNATPVGHVAAQLRKQHRANELLAQCENSASNLLPGFTGYIPHMRERFGEQYQRAAAAAQRVSADASAARAASRSKTPPAILQGDRDREKPGHLKSDDATDAPNRSPELNPIPGYTGFMRLSRYAYSHTFGCVSKMLPSGELEREVCSMNLPEKDLSKNSPIPGYKGFVPLYQMHGQRAFGPTSKECISEHKKLVRNVASEQEKAIPRFQQ